jgi:hypothetical protein
MEEGSDDNNTNINRQQDNKGEESKGTWVLSFFVFLLFGFSFVVGPFFYTFVKLLKKNYHQESSHYLQIKHNTKFLLQRMKLCHNLGFSWFLS